MVLFIGVSFVTPLLLLGNRAQTNWFIICYGRKQFYRLRKGIGFQQHRKQTRNLNRVRSIEVFLFLWIMPFYAKFGILGQNSLHICCTSISCNSLKSNFISKRSLYFSCAFPCFFMDLSVKMPIFGVKYYPNWPPAIIILTPYSYDTDPLKEVHLRGSVW